MKGLVFGVLMIIISCNGPKRAATKIGTTDTNEKLTLLLQDNYSGSEVAEILVIKDSKALKSFYSKINRTRKPGLPVPDIDFTKEMILIHCSGERTSGDYALLSVAEENEKEVIISASVKKSEKSKTSSAHISPFSVYKMPFTTKEISFKK